MSLIRASRCHHVVYTQAHPAHSSAFYFLELMSATHLTSYNTTRTGVQSQGKNLTAQSHLLSTIAPALFAQILSSQSVPLYRIIIIIFKVTFLLVGTSSSKTNFLGCWEDGSLRKGLTLLAWECDCGPQPPCKSRARWSALAAPTWGKQSQEHLWGSLAGKCSLIRK